MQLRDRIKELRRVPASSLKPNPKNWRTHPQAQQDALRGVLAEVGIADAVLARELPDGSLMLVDGHLRADTITDAEIPVLILDVNEAEADKILATLDPLAAMAEADAAKLDALLREVQTGNESLAEMLTDLAEEAGVLSDDKKEIVEDEPPEPPVVPITKPGDLWLLGRHRVLCGDSTKAEDVARLMAGAKADLCFTSPPYNVGSLGWAGKSKYANDADDRAQFDDFLSSFTRTSLCFADIIAVNIQSVSGNKIQLIEWLYEFRRHLADTIIWDKCSAEPAMEPGVMNSVWEYLFILSSSEDPTRKLSLTTWRGTVDNVIRVGKQSRNEFSDLHRATFPVEFAASVLRVFDKAGVILEPFCGSGTTLIAAEQLNRTCYGMEISPQYCDVIIKRWEKLTGQTAKLSKE